MTDYVSYSTRRTIILIGDTVFSEHGYTVETEDEAAGPFIVVKNIGEGTGLKVDKDGWRLLRQSIEDMLVTCELLDGGAQ